MNPVVEEALTNIIRRLNDIEEFQRKYFAPKNEPQNQKPRGMDNATPGQIKYLSALGFEVFEGLTKAQAGQQIDRLVKEKDEKKFSDDVQKSVIEPLEVDTDDAGLDDEDLL